MHKVNKVVRLPLMGLFMTGLAACGGGSSSDSSDTRKIEGQAIKGVLANGIVRAFKIAPDTQERILLGRTSTDEAGHFEFHVNDGNNSEDDIILLEFEADTNSFMLCDLLEGCRLDNNAVYQFGEQVPLSEDFTLVGLASGDEAHLSSLSHLLVSTSINLLGGLTADNIQHASQWIEQALLLGQPILSTKTADLTSLYQTPELTEAELSNGIWSAVFFELSQQGEWQDLTIHLDNIPLAELYADATSLATELSSTINNSYAYTLNNIAATVREEHQRLIDEDLAILQQPQSVTIDEGTGFSLSVTTSESGNATYQWFKDGVEISGATESRLTISSSIMADQGTYNVNVANDSVSLTSLHALVTVNEVIDPIVITTQPLSQNVQEGNALTLSVAANGEGPLEYQWMRGGSVIPGATSPVYTITAANLSDEGSYRVVISNGHEEISSDYAEVIINENIAPVEIINQPQSVTVTEGMTATLTINATGGGFLTYQWLKGGFPIASATTNTLEIASTSMSDAGFYSVQVANTQGSLTSQAVELSVLSASIPITITQHPASVSEYEGESALFNVSATGGTGLQYQWYKDGLKIDGATQSLLSLGNLSLSDNGLYSVDVYDAHSRETSLSALLTVETHPKPDIILSWDIPTQREDGSTLELSDISGFIIEYGDAANNLANSAFVGVQQTEYALPDLSFSTIYVRIATVDSEGIQGRFSDTVSIALP